jgi:hypothetical protein
MMPAALLIVAIVSSPPTLLDSPALEILSEFFLPLAPLRLCGIFFFFVLFVSFVVTSLLSRQQRGGVADGFSR